MHADERNSKLSEQLGRDIYHYHLHVVYVPVVEKNLYYKKNNANPELAGKLKATIPQISQSNKWPLRMTVEVDGKTVTRNSYSFLQDRYYEHMRGAGYEGFERGERGSTTEHLEVLDYKIKQDLAYSQELEAEIKKKELDSASLDRQTGEKKKLNEKLDRQITVKEKAAATIAEIDAMGKPALLGGFNVSEKELKKLKTLSKKSVNADKRIANAYDKLEASEKALADMTRSRDIWKKRHDDLMNEVKDFISAIRNFPQRLREFIRQVWQERSQEKTHSREVSR